MRAESGHIRGVSVAPAISEGVRIPLVCRHGRTSRGRSERRERSRQALNQQHYRKQND